MRGAPRSVKVLLEQPGWAVSQARYYQAGGDIHIHGRESETRTPADRWKVWVGMVVVVLTAATLGGVRLERAAVGDRTPGARVDARSAGGPGITAHLWDRHGRVRRPYSGGEGGIAGLFGLNRHTARWRLLTPGPWTQRVGAPQHNEEWLPPLERVFPPSVERSAWCSADNDPPRPKTNRVHPLFVGCICNPRAGNAPSGADGCSSHISVETTIERDVGKG